MLFCFFLFFQNTDKLSDCKFSTTMSKLMKIKVPPSSTHHIPGLGPASLCHTCDLFSPARNHFFFFSNPILLSILGKSWFEPHTLFCNTIIFSGSFWDSVALHFFFPTDNTSFLIRIPIIMIVGYLCLCFNYLVWLGLQVWDQSHNLKSLIEGPNKKRKWTTFNFYKCLLCFLK